MRHISHAIRTLAFWPCLLFAAALYAAVALSPPLLTYLTLRQQRDEGNLRLVSLDEQVERGKKVIDALQHDSNFAKEMARADFKAAHPDEQRIPVDAALALPHQAAAPDLAVTPPDLPWYAPFVRLIADHHQFGNLLLTIAALLVVYAFAWLQEPTQEPGVRSQESKNSLRSSSTRRAKLTPEC